MLNIYRADISVSALTRSDANGPGLQVGAVSFALETAEPVGRLCPLRAHVHDPLDVSRAWIDVAGFGPLADASRAISHLPHVVHNVVNDLFADIGAGQLTRPS